jgi:hypothetical protein
MVAHAAKAVVKFICVLMNDLWDACPLDGTIGALVHDPAKTYGPSTFVLANVAAPV